MRQFKCHDAKTVPALVMSLPLLCIPASSRDQPALRLATGGLATASACLWRALPGGNVVSQWLLVRGIYLETRPRPPKGLMDDQPGG